MMVMVSLNLADIMTATLPRTAKTLHDHSDNPPDADKVKNEEVPKGLDAENLGVRRPGGALLYPDSTLQEVSKAPA